MKIGNIEFHRPAALSLRAQSTFARLVLRYTMFLLIAFFLFLFVAGISIYFITKTDWFHRWSAQKLEEVLANELEAKLEFSSIEFNVFRGVELDSVRLITKGDTVLKANSLQLYYELEPLLIRRIVIREVLLDRADIRLLRNTHDSTWNVAHIVKPKQDTTETKPFDWSIYIRDVAIQHSIVTVHDSLSGEPLPDRMHYTKMKLRDFNCSLSAALNIARQDFSVCINSMSFHEQRTNFTANDIHLCAEVDSTRLGITAMRLITPTTNMFLRANIDSVNIFRSGAKIEEKPLTLEINSKALDAKDINWFMPSTFTLANTFSLHTVCYGTLNNLLLEVDEVTTGSSNLHGTLELNHLTDDKTLAYTINLTPSKASYPDFRVALPTLQLPDINFLERLAFRPTTVYGKGDSIYCDVDVTGDFGTIDGIIELKTTKVLGYKATIDCRNFNIAGFTHKSSNMSDINGYIHVNGSGTTLEEAIAKTDIELKNSSYAGRTIESLRLLGSTTNGLLQVDSLNVHFPWSSKDSSDAFFMSGEPKEFTAKGTLDLSNTSRPTYDMNIGLLHMPLAELLQYPAAPRLLSGGLDIKGTGFHPDSLSAGLNAHFEEFVLVDRALFPFTLNTNVTRLDAEHRKVELFSGPFDAVLSGRFKLGTFGQVFLAQLNMIDKTIRKGFAIMESDTSASSNFTPYDLPTDELDMRYKVKVKNLSPISPFLVGVRLNAQGDVSGYLRGKPDCYELGVDTARVPKFSLQVGETYMRAMPINLSMILRTENMNTIPSVMQADIETSCDSVFRADNTYFVQPTFWLRFIDDRAQFAASTWLDNKMPIRVRGDITMEDREFNVILDSLKFGLNTAFSFSAKDKVRATITPRGTMVHQLTMKHDSSQATISANGVFNFKRFDGMNFIVKNFDISQLQKIREVAAIQPLQLLNGKVDSLAVTVSDKFTNPKFSIDGIAYNLRYNNVLIGNQDIHAKFDGTTLSGYASVVNPSMNSQTKTLDISIHQIPLQFSIIPFNLGLRNKEKLDIEIRANRLSMAAVAPFIPGVTNVNGIANAGMSIAGITPDNIDYTGLVTYDSCSLLVPATNIRYTSKGGLRLQNNVVLFDSIDVYNEPSDLRGGHARATGKMFIRGFNVDSIAFKATVNNKEKLLVMSDATAAVNRDMYGRTVISTTDGKENKSLNFFGRLDNPQLDGFVMLEEADIKFPPSNNVASKTSSFNYKRVGNNYFYTTVEERKEIKDTTIGDLPKRTETYTVSQRTLGQAFTDILTTKVNVKINNVMDIRMDFGFNDQLSAKVEQENPKDYLEFIRDGNRSTKLIGRVVVKQSTYKFYNNFNATGRLDFATGQIDNPALNLTAIYKGDRAKGDDQRKEEYTITMSITGTKKIPRVVMDYQINGIDHPGVANTDQEKITSNALLMTLFGRTQEEFLSGGKSGGLDAGGSVNQGINSAASSAASALLTSAVQGGIVKDIAVDFGGNYSDLSQARIKLTGQVLGANVTLGGTMADLSTNSTITIDARLSDILGIDVGSATTQFTKTTNPTQNVTRQQKEWELKAGYRWP
ncbi:MAG: translocation/assembly module TamB domain-containing protein [Candidatus Kapaibacterium sp.]|nr:translocation/assembly module TamB [Bacteroidota bacterium]